MHVLLKVDNHHVHHYTQGPDINSPLTRSTRFDVNNTFNVSYIEIYMERVQDLLVPATVGTTTTTSSRLAQTATSQLKVREHPKTGPFVEHVTRKEVSTVEEIKELMEQGNAHR